MRRISVTHSNTIATTDASVRGERGPVFGPLTVSSQSPVTFVTGPRGSGRTSFMLALAGRMKLATGTVATLGETKQSRIRTLTGIVGFADIDALEPQVTVAAIIRERLAWASPWYRRIPRIDDAFAAELMGEVFGPAGLPPVSTLVRDLTPADEMLLRIGLAMLEEPSMLIIDDIDQLRDPADRVRVAEQLAVLVSRGIRLVASTSDPRDIDICAEALAANTRTAQVKPTVITL